MLSPPRRLLRAVIVGVAALGLAGCTYAASNSSGHNSAPSSPSVATSTPFGSPDTANDSNEQLLLEASTTLEGLHQDSQGGWAFESQIQAPNDQTDRDVGAASVGMGFLSLADRYPDNPRWLSDAKHTAAWLMAVAHRDDNGDVWWTDYVNGTQESSSIYTSFDDGALGIGDFFWQLYQKTNDPEYKSIAMGTVDWTLSQAENVGSTNVPAYRWVWDISTRGSSLSGNNPPLYSMGMGVVGTINTLATYYQRTSVSDPEFAARCKQYMDGALQYLQQARSTLGQNGGDSNALPETGVVGQDGDTAEDSGYLSGAAGAAYMYLHLYQVFGDQKYLSEAQGLLNWLTSSDGPKADVQTGIAWHIAIDSQDSSNSDNAKIATGFEEGDAGIGWTFLQAYNVTGNQDYLTTARQAGDWLLSVAIKNSNGGYSWPEDYNPTSPYIRPNLDNGAAGISMFFYDLYVTTHDIRYLSGVQGTQKWIANTAIHNGKQVWWADNDDGNSFAKDPSWHWGIAGIIAALNRETGGTMDIPGEEPALARH
jgi:lantibiotic modifying enzyme